MGLIPFLDLSYFFSTVRDSVISYCDGRITCLGDTDIQCSLGLSPPRFIASLAYRQNSHLFRFPPLKIPRYTAKLSYRHPPQIFRHKSPKTNLNFPVSTAHNYHLTAVYWWVIMECQNWSSDTVIDRIVEGWNRWSVVLIKIITCIYFSSDYICTFNPK